MAFKENNKHNDANTSEEFRQGTFNIHQAVGGIEIGSGFAAPNQVTDMQLVYYMIYMIARYGDRSVFPISSESVFKNENILPRNQNFHSQKTKKELSRMIFMFQTNLKLGGRNIFVDGRCDKARSAFSSISHTPYTIHFANYHYAKTIKKIRNITDWQNYLLNDLMLPDSVRTELSVSAVV